MAEIDTGGPAFPTPGDSKTGGLTLRDYFAAAALPAVMREPLRGLPLKDDKSPGAVALMAYLVADAMVAQRGEPAKIG